MRAFLALPTLLLATVLLAADTNPPIPNADKVKKDLVGKVVRLGDELPKGFNIWQFDTGTGHKLNLDIQRTAIIGDRLEVTVKLRNNGC